LELLSVCIGHLAILRLKFVWHSLHPNAFVVALRPELDAFLKKRVQPCDAVAKDIPL
jgi:hypothetical protein